MKKLTAHDHTAAALSRIAAASYIGVCTTTLDKLVDAGAIKPPRMIGTVKRYRHVDLDEVLSAAPFADGGDGEVPPLNPFDIRLGVYDA